MNTHALIRKSIGIGTLQYPSEFAKRILIRAQELGLKKGDLAKKAGISAPTLRAVLKMGEKGVKEMPHLETLIALAYALKVHPFWLIEGLFNNIQLPIHITQEVIGDRFGFVADTTYPDGSLVSPGCRFLKKWMIQNLGNTPWINRRMVCYDEEVLVCSKKTGEPLHAAKALKPDDLEIIVPFIDVGEVIELQMWFTAPTVPGTYVSYWLPFEQDSSQCFHENTSLWTLVHVTTLADTMGFTPHC